jgi:predicted dehydrogenase
MTSTINIGILSVAHPGHAASYASAVRQLDGAALVAMYDEDPDRAADFAGRFDIPVVYATPDELLARDDIHAVIVCSATDEHAPLVIAAARAGMHVLCEKPIATRVEDAQTMIAACHEAGVQLHVAFVSRFLPALQEAKRIVQGGEIGAVFGMMGGNRGRPPLPPVYPAWIATEEHAGGGAVIDHSVHVTDAMRFVTGAEVVRVQAEAATLYNDGLGVDDCGLLLLTFNDGTVASVDPSWSLPEANPFHYDFYLRVAGLDGALALDDTRQSLRVASDAASHRREVWEPFGVNIDFHLVRHFVDCVRDGAATPPYASGEDGLRALEIALAAYESARTGLAVELAMTNDQRRTTNDE